MEKGTARWAARRMMAIAGHEEELRRLVPQYRLQQRKLVAWKEWIEKELWRIDDDFQKGKIVKAEHDLVSELLTGELASEEKSRMSLFDEIFHLKEITGDDTLDCLTGMDYLVALGIL